MLIILWNIFAPHVAKALQPSGGGASDSFVAEPTPIKNAQLKAAIAECESHNDPLATNPYSTAKGIYQFLDGTWRHYAKLHWGTQWVNHHVFNEADNRELGEWVIDTYGTNDWLASKSCWG